MIEGMLITENRFNLPTLFWREGRFSISSKTELTYAGDPLGTVHVALPADLLPAVPKRRSEYLAGRICATLALRAAGFPEVLNTTGRCPIWPKGTTGSISHSDHRVVAAVSCDLASLGVDCETIMSAVQAQEIHEMILTPAEAALRPQPVPFATYLTLIFSAKEAFYKAFSARLGRVLEFHEVSVVGVAPDRLRLVFESEALEVLYRLDATGCLTLAQVPR
jgi:enterobactin synthetase component D